VFSLSLRNVELILAERGFMVDADVQIMPTIVRRPALPAVIVAMEAA
jgi:hypothetical protein